MTCRDLSFDDDHLHWGKYTTWCDLFVALADEVRKGTEYKTEQDLAFFLLINKSQLPERKLESHLRNLADWKKGTRKPRKAILLEITKQLEIKNNTALYDKWFSLYNSEKAQVNHSNNEEYMSVEALSYFAKKINLFLQSKPFSIWLLSVHISLAAVYLFFSISLTWLIGGSADLGINTPILPGNDFDVRNPNQAFDSSVVVKKRPIVITIVAIIVMISAIGMLSAAFIKGKSESVKKIGVFALLGSVANFCILWIVGFDILFCVLYALVLSCVALVAHSFDIRTVLGYLFPVALLLSVLVVMLVSLVHPSAKGAAGILPSAAFITMLVGGFSKKNHGGKSAIICSIIFTAVLGILYSIYFDGFFFMNPWEPGTTTFFLMLPLSNGIWDWASLSLTRQISYSAIDKAKNVGPLANRILICAVLVDIVFALLLVMALFFTIEIFTYLYNAYLYDGLVVLSLTDYFWAFQNDTFSARSLFVLLMIFTLFLPTIMHIHIVLRAVIFQNSNAENRAQYMTKKTIYGVIMLSLLALLLYFARFAIDIISVLIPLIVSKV